MYALSMFMFVWGILESTSGFQSWFYNNPGCPQQCLCNKDISNVRCANLTVTSLPDVLANLPTSVKFIHLQGNNLEEIPNGTFEEATQLKILDLSNNNIHTIEKYVFQPLDQLETLLLQDNKLNTGGIEQLKITPSVRIINLANNLISGDIHLAINSWSNVQKLYLQYNSITMLPINFFMQCSALKEVNASHNAIVALKKATSALGFFTYNLAVLDLSWNSISLVDPSYFHMFPNLTHLFLQRNRISNLADLNLFQLTHLQYLDLSNNYFELLYPNIFIDNTELVELQLTFLPNLTTINPVSFHGLSSLQLLNVSHNERLSHLHIHSFQQLEHLTTLDLSYNALHTLHEGIFTNLSHVEQIALQGNPLSCDCNLKWIIGEDNATDHFLSAINVNDLKCASPDNFTGQYFQDIPSSNLPCKHPTIGHYSATQFFPIGQSAILNCLVDGDPIPATIWKTPRGKILYHHQAFVSLDDIQPNDIGYHLNHSWHHSDEYSENHDTRSERIHILQNGSLYFDFVIRNDAGHYTCIAQNELGNVSVTISFRLDFSILPKQTTLSIIFGFAASGCVLVISLVIGLIRYIAQLCVQWEHKKKRRTIRDIIESLESYRLAKIDKISAYKTEKMDKISAYKSDKLYKISAYKSEKWDKFSAYKSAKVEQLKTAKEHTFTSLINYLKSTREHYTQQINGVKENCSDQAQKLRENYHGRISRIKDYKTQHIEKIRENYHGQVTKIKEYGSGQMEKLREQYKTQQQYVFKLLELMNLENCRTGVEAECMHTEAMLFEPDITIDIDPVLPPVPENMDTCSLAESDDYITASSNSDTSSQEESSRQVTLDVGPSGQVIFDAKHSDIEEKSEDIKSDETTCQNEYFHVKDLPRLVEDSGEGTSYSRPHYKKSKGKKSSHKKQSDAGTPETEASSKQQDESSHGYEISIISASVPAYNTETTDYIPRESSV